MAGTTHQIRNQIVPQKKITAHIEEEAPHDAQPDVGNDDRGAFQG